MRLWALVVVVGLGLAACSGGGGLTDGCMKPCTDSRDCGPGFHCVALHWFGFNRGCYEDDPRTPVCIRGDCPGYWQSCINDTAWSEDGCISEDVAPVSYNEPNHFHYGTELVYCPNGCEDTCSQGGCDGGAKGHDAHCK